MTAININFDSMDRKMEYPNISEIKFADNDLILSYINGLPVPENSEQISIFNEIWKEFHLRGGK